MCKAEEACLPGERSLSDLAQPLGAPVPVSLAGSLDLPAPRPAGAASLHDGSRGTRTRKGDILRKPITAWLDIINQAPLLDQLVAEDTIAGSRR